MQTTGEITIEEERPQRQPRPHWLEAVADPVRLRILRCLSEHARATVPEIARAADASRQTVRRHLDSLVAFGVVTRVPGLSNGERVGRPATIYHLASDTRESVEETLRVAQFRVRTGPASGPISPSSTSR
jgi:DNA-binding transcriptional ArsR family regulator